MSLNTLHLDSNQLSRDIPASLGNLVRLEELLLSNNQLTGEIPAVLGSLSSLKKLHINNNELSGSIPASLGDLGDLVELNVANNLLSGSVPAELGMLSKLVLMYLDNNELRGELPSELSKLDNLNLVSLSRNRFTWAEQYSPGILADLVGLLALYESTRGDSWDNNSNWNSAAPVETWHGVAIGPGGLVTELNLRDNGLSGKIPPELENLTTLSKLDVGLNELTQEIPDELGSITDLEVLNLTDNGLNGGIPSELGNLANLEELHLAHNQLSGPVPPELGNLSRLRLLYLDNNRLSGELPIELGSLSNLRQVSIWDNSLTWAVGYVNGHLADTVALVAFYESAFDESTKDRSRRTGGWLSYKPLSQWNVSSPSSSWTHDGRSFRNIDMEGGRVVSLFFGKGYLQGQIPPAMANLTGLTEFIISNQNHLYPSRPVELTGCIPASLQGINYDGEAPGSPGFCTGATSKKALSPPAPSLLG